MAFKLLVVALACLLFLSFIVFSFFTAKEKFSHLDFDTTVKLQNHVPKKYDMIFSLLSVVGSPEITGLVWIACLLLVFLKRFWWTVSALFLFLGSAFFEIFGKLFLFHPGPPKMFFRGVLEVNFPSHYIQTNYSYPSGHLTRISFILSFVLLWFILRGSNTGKFWAKLGFIIGMASMVISRIVLGEHWLSDVIGGILLGTSLGLLAGITLPQKKNLAIT